MMRNALQTLLVILLAAPVLFAEDAGKDDEIRITSTPASEWTEGIEYFQKQTAETTSHQLRWTISDGSLPAGLDLSEEGDLSGTPTEAGSFAFTLKVTDEFDASGTKDCRIEINGKVAVLGHGLMEWTEDSQLSHSFEASGGTGALSYELSDGDLPEGLSLDEKGLLSGTPKATGTFRFTVSAEDSLGSVGAAEFELQINDAPTIAELVQDTWTMNRKFATDMAVQGGTGPYSWTVSGDLPLGLTGAGDGALFNIAGTPELAGEVEFSIEVEDSAGAVASAVVTLSINEWPTIDTAEFPQWTANHAFSEQLPVARGTSPYSFRVIDGQLPPGISVDQDGVLRGTPTEAGSFGFRIEVEDAAGATADQEFLLSISEGLEIVAPTLSEWTVGVGLDPAAFGLHGGTGDVAYSSVSGIPAGIEFGEGGKLSGTPSEDGVFNIRIEAKDGIGATATYEAVWVINDAPAFDEDDYIDWTAGEAYDQQIGSSGGTAPLKCEIVDGSLPVGLALDFESGAAKISGTPTEAGSYDFDIRITDANGAEAVLSASIVVNPRPAIATTDLPDWSASHAFSQVIETIGGTAPLSISLTGGNLPEGFELSEDGLLSGSTEAVGRHDFRIEVVDAAGARASIQLGIRINPALSFSPEFPEWTASVPFTHVLSATGGTGDHEWKVSAGSLPAGISLDAHGSLTGEPTEDGAFTFTIRAEDETGAATEEVCTWKINPALSDIEGEIRDWTVGKYFSADLRSTGGTAPFSWEIDAGSLPEGLALIIDGEEAILSGVPAVSGESSFDIKVTDGVGATASRSVSFTINADLEFAADDTLICALGRSADFEFRVSGGTAPYSSSVSSNTPLPEGLMLDEAGLRIVGKTQATGLYPLKITVNDAAGVSVTVETEMYIAEEVLFREKASGVLGEGDGSKYCFFDAIAGSRVDLTFQFDRGQDYSPAIELLQDGAPVNMANAKVKTSASKWSVKNLTVPSTGRYFVRIDNEGARYVGEYRIRSRAKMPKSTSFNGSAEAPVNAGDVDFHLVPGCQISLQINADARIDDREIALISPSGEVIALSAGQAKYKESRDGRSVAISKLKFLGGGQFQLHIGLDAEGDFEGRIKIKAPRQYRFVLDD
jgi:hypothetical protein